MELLGKPYDPYKGMVMTKRSGYTESGEAFAPEFAELHPIGRHFYEVGTIPHYYRERGWCEESRGFRRVIVCTPQFIRDLARKLWENKKNHDFNPYLAVHVKGPSVKHPGGMIYEGCKPAGWQTAYPDDKEVEFFCCNHKALCTDGKDHDFYLQIPVDEIVSIHVLS
jgi:hypothetical protein